MYNTESDQWSVGPSLLRGRKNLNCGRIRADRGSDQFSIIIAGGLGPLVEILDHGSDVWRQGPELPFKVSVASMVEDSEGGVILVGGYSETGRVFE